MLLAPVERDAGVRPAAPGSRGAFVNRRWGWVLLAITVLAGVGRFTWLDRPPIWGDEAYTYVRAVMPYRAMLETLRDDGFPPLFYDVYWLQARVAPLTPRAMRVIPAVAGTLMVPAMYALAAQLFPRRRGVALLTAAFTACSAYMMAYSHDAKMYMPAWLCLTAHVTALLWWLRLRAARDPKTRLAWLAWVASGVAMGGLHLVCLAVLPVEVIAFLTCAQLRQWRAIVAFAGGVVIVAAGPVGYELGFNRWSKNIENEGFTAASGLEWVEALNTGRTGPELARYAGSAYLYGWEWPGHFPLGRTDPDVRQGLQIAGGVTLVLLAIGLLPWRRRADDAPPAPLYATLLPAAWVVVPAYGFYCASMRQFASPGDWVATGAAGVLTPHPWFLAAAVAVTVGALMAWPRGARWVMGLIPAAALGLFLFCAAGVSWGDAGRRHAEYFSMFEAWWARATDGRVLASLVGVAGVCGLFACADTWPERWRRAARVLLAAAVLLVATAAVWVYFTAQFDGKVGRVLRQYRDPSRAAAVAEVRRNLAPGAVVEVAAADVERRADLLLAARKQSWERQVALERSWAKSPVTAERAERQLAERVVWQGWVSAWMPRYVGIVWPAVACATCALLLRLPTRGLRWTAVALFLALNVGQSVARLRADTEPPFDRMAADVAAAQGSLHGRPQAPAVRTFLAGVPGSQLFSAASKYYLAQYSDEPMDLAKFRVGPGQQRRAMPDARPNQPWAGWGLTIAYDASAKSIVEDLSKHPEADRLVLWEMPTFSFFSAPVSEQLKRALPAGWRPSRDEVIPVRMHWTWGELYTLRRREWVRGESE